MPSTIVTAVLSSVKVIFAEGTGPDKYLHWAFVASAGNGNTVLPLISVA